MQERPEDRSGQRLLAAEATRLVHGDAALTAAQSITSALFDGDVRGLEADEIAQLEQDGMACTTITPHTGLLTAMVVAGLATSNGAARKLVQGGGVYVNGVAVVEPTMQFDAAMALHGRYFLLRRGKRNWHLFTLSD